MADKTEKRASFWLKLSFRVFINVGLVLFFNAYLPDFFILEGGYQAIAIVGLTLALLNWLVVPVLNVLSLPIKFIAWIVAFLLTNIIALWLTATFVSSLNVAGVALTIGGGVIGWLVLSVILGFSNWIIKSILK